MASETLPTPKVGGTSSTMASDERPKGNPPQVGVSAIILNREGKVLVGKRIGSHGAGSWQFPGGKLDYGEALLDCGVRESKEETMLDVEGVRIVAYTNDVFVSEGRHFITPFALCKMKDADAEPMVMEKDKCESWSWWNLEKLFEGRDGDNIDGAPLFLPLFNLVQQFKDADEFKKILQ
ncbi:NUDIX hydrolase domain protein [Cordyceps fumosorosea ARSEF 2679]|uniref:NUDIX hydrolase domain protein n=1 Tax=Cordyceps fumosorosea (strain ARSEF 2679) TaxID=1081104 RepID=A0A167V753_CORFA|nr:NUDIX hydrolase domain protein [Cordyceps fumosorosea ARSEF 2679]OAA62296.1 NUDIX hydrolase domain protein [Cordyceps fumosorosea ARSEF 2679]